MPPFANWPVAPTGRQVRRVQRLLLKWFRRAARELPWRNTRDAYRVWISEVMLQQTQVATVVPYFERFMHRFPSVATLASADEREVLTLWEGLGYYRRARQLHQAARQIVAAHAGDFPADPLLAAALPGVGRYTLGAVLSQAYGQRLPAVDGNVIRVLARWFACSENPRQARIQRWFWDIADQLVPAEGPGDFNQALMELGQTICTPRRPQCGACPVRSMCRAFDLGAVERFPPAVPRPQATAVREVAVILEARRKLLILQRHASGRWGNLWEFPHGEIRERETAAAAAQRLAVEQTGLDARRPRPLFTLDHQVTRFRISLEVFHAETARRRVRLAAHRAAEWRAASELAAFPLSRPHRRALDRWVADTKHRG